MPTRPQGNPRFNRHAKRGSRAVCADWQLAVLRLSRTSGAIVGDPAPRTFPASLRLDAKAAPISARHGSSRPISGASQAAGHPQNGWAGIEHPFLPREPTASRRGCGVQHVACADPPCVLAQGGERAPKPRPYPCRASYSPPGTQRYWGALGPPVRCPGCTCGTRAGGLSYRSPWHRTGSRCLSASPST